MTRVNRFWRKKEGDYVERAILQLNKMVYCLETRGFLPKQTSSKESGAVT